MAILNLAGNFQPPPVTAGKNLPSSVGRAPSSSNRLDQTQFAATKELASIAKENAVKTENSDAKSQPAKGLVKQEVTDQIEALQQYNQSIDRSLQFSVDEELGVTIVRVVDKQTEEIIRQFPPEELINLSRRLKELNDQNTENKGILLQEKV